MLFHCCNNVKTTSCAYWEERKFDCFPGEIWNSLNIWKFKRKWKINFPLTSCRCSLQHYKKTNQIVNSQLWKRSLQLISIHTIICTSSSSNSLQLLQLQISFFFSIVLCFVSVFIWQISFSLSQYLKRSSQGFTFHSLDEVCSLIHTSLFIRTLRL